MYIVNLFVSISMVKRSSYLYFSVKTLIIDFLVTLNQMNVNLFKIESDNVNKNPSYFTMYVYVFLC